MSVEVLDMTEKEYRAYPALSYSRLSDIEKVGIDAVNANVASIGKLRGVVLGSIVDDIVSNKLENAPDYIVKVDKIPGSGTITDRAIEAFLKQTNFGQFIDVPKGYIKKFLNDNGFMKNGMNDSNFYEKLVNYEGFINASSNADEDTQIVTEYDYKIAMKSAKRLRDKYPLFSASFKDNSEDTLTYQVKLLAKINGIEIKCMLDAVHFDHVNKTIEPIDIKTGALSESDFQSFYHGAYLRYNYYIQAGLYRKIVTEYFKRDLSYSDYEVLPFKFVYSTTNPKTSMRSEDLFVHIISQEEYVKSFKGFDYVDTEGMPACKLGIGELVRFYKENKTILTAPATKYAAIA
jgi:hypothetical protein